MTLKTDEQIVEDIYQKEIMHFLDSSHELPSVVDREMSDYSSLSKVNHIIDDDNNSIGTPLNRKIKFLKKNRDRRMSKEIQFNKKRLFNVPKIRYHNVEEETIPKTPSNFLKLSSRSHNETSSQGEASHFIDGPINAQDFRYVRKASMDVDSSDIGKREEEEHSSDNDSELDKVKELHKLMVPKPKLSVIQRLKNANKKRNSFRRSFTARKKIKKRHLANDKDRENRIPHHFFRWGVRMLPVDKKQRINFSKQNMPNAPRQDSNVQKSNRDEI